MRYEDATPEELEALNEALDHLQSFSANLSREEHYATNGAVLATEFSTVRKDLEERFPNSEAVKRTIEKINQLFNKAISELSVL